MASGAVDVAVPLPVQTSFSYRVPDAFAAPPRGARVLVPVGARRVIGVVTGPAADGDRDLSLKELVEVVDDTPPAPPALLDLAAWVSEHYLAPPGECYRLVLPPSGVRTSRAVARLTGVPPESPDPLLDQLRSGPVRVSTLAHRLGRDAAPRLARLRQAGLVAVEQELDLPAFRRPRLAVIADASHRPRGRAQAEVLERLTAAGGTVAVADLLRDRASLRGALARLQKAGAVRIEDADRGAMEEVPARTGALEPSADQARVLGPLLAAVSTPGYHAFLLHGITGSGKTEIYLRAAERTLERGRDALVLVPEIALTPSLVRAARARFGSIVSVLHSGLSAGERHDHWWRIREGRSRVVVGARSAVFAPLARVGLIVVDEEHESAYKQEESPRYNGRDVAVMRARLEGATVVLGSATPSVESYANAIKGKYGRLVLPARVGAQGLPRVEVVDRREVLRQGGDAILTPPLREALAACLQRREQALLLLNRRGYATSLLCRECGQPAACPNCSVSLTLHDGARFALCHYCGHRSLAPRACGLCRGAFLRLTGYGTEKVVEAVRGALPQARVDRLDRDRAGRRGAVETILAAFAAGELDVLVGTQMIAKGHDFPRVTLVGVVDADVGLGLPDFRAAERTFQLLTQVAGRAGRADLAGEVILQSHWPDHYSLRLACAQDYQAFYVREMEFRETMAYPPTAALVNLIVQSRRPAEGARAAEALADRLRQGAGGRYRVLGPASAPLARLRSEHRFQVLLKGDRASMRGAVRRALLERYGEVRWPGVVVDVDPASVM